MTTDLNFGPGNASKVLMGNSYTINEHATEYGDGSTSAPANVTLVLGNPDVSVNVDVTGGIGDASGEGEYVHPASLTLVFANRLNISGEASTFGNGPISAIDGQAANITLVGPQVDNNGQVGLDFSVAHITSSVVGTGSWDMWLSDLSITGEVGAGQQFNVGPGSQLNVMAPEFHGSVNLSDYGQVTLSDLTATSYSYANNNLVFYDGNRVMDSVKVGVGQGNQLYVAHSAGGVIASTNPSVVGSMLPQHTFGA